MRKGLQVYKAFNMVFLSSKQANEAIEGYSHKEDITVHWASIDIDAYAELVENKEYNLDYYGIELFDTLEEMEEDIKQWNE